METILDLASLIGLVVDAHGKEKSLNKLNDDRRATLSLPGMDLILDDLVVNVYYRSTTSILHKNVVADITDRRVPIDTCLLSAEGVILS